MTICVLFHQHFYRTAIEIFPDLISSFSHLIEIISRKKPFTSRFVNELSNVISASSDKRPSKWF